LAADLKKLEDAQMQQIQGLRFACLHPFTLLYCFYKVMAENLSAAVHVMFTQMGFKRNSS